MSPPLHTLLFVSGVHHTVPTCVITNQHPVCVCGVAAQQRFAKTPNADKLAELEALRDFLKSGVKALDDRTQQVTAPAERLKTLLMSKDKKACIHELAGMPFLVAHVNQCIVPPHSTGTLCCCMPLRMIYAILHALLPARHIQQWTV